MLQKFLLPVILLPLLQISFCIIGTSNGIRKFKKTSVKRARCFSCIVRFFDKQTVLNDCGEFERGFHESYIFLIT